jgi:hypothetical protein
VARKGQAFEADLSQYDAKHKKIIQKAIDSGFLNNTNKTHDMVDLLAKLSADRGVDFDFTNNEKLKESGFALNGKFVNGFYSNGKITLNMNSAKTLDSVVGHEITHVLEGTELYNTLQNSIIEYSKAKGDYQGRLDALTKLYEGVKDADVNKELTADLVGDYLFTDEDFVRHLSTTDRNVFQKIFDEMDYSKIEKDANEAYRTMNLSAKEYLDMMNSVGATFASSMGDEKGYDTAKKGLQAIADYASGTGADINNLNEKYKMITRSTTSYLSIADQFSGILPQTTDGFLKQAQASGFLSKEYKKLNEVPVAEYQQAISSMLEKGVADMGLLGNTVTETETTLTGSLNALKASWNNFLSGSGNLSQVVDSAEIAFENIIRIVSEAVPDIIDNISDSLPQLLELGGQIIGKLIDGIFEYLPELTKSTNNIILNFVSDIIDQLPEIVGAGAEVISNLIQGIASMLPSVIPQAVECIITIVNGLLDNIDMLIDARNRTNLCFSRWPYRGIANIN